MLNRILEPEVMDTAAEAVDYNSMDHSTVNRVFVDDFLAALPPVTAVAEKPGHSNFPECVAGVESSSLQSADDLLGARRLDPCHSNPAKTGTIRQIFDAGTGTALIPLELMSRGIRAVITASDLAEQMLVVARENVRAAGQENFIRLVRSDCKQLPDASAGYDAVISNSIVHHIPEPRLVLAELWRILKPGGLLFVRDLMRPTDAATLEGLVQAYAGAANPHQQQMFRDSLHAALTIDEVGELLRQFKIPTTGLRATSDRHWTIVAYKI